jgi:hypothetical protein
MPIPVMHGDKFLGHLICTAKGIRAFDAYDRELGYFATEEGAVMALQKLAKPAKRRAMSLKRKV